MTEDRAREALRERLAEVIILRYPSFDPISARGIADALLPVVVAEKAAADRKLARAVAFTDRLARIHNHEHERVHAGQATPEVRDLIRRLHDELRAALADDREGGE